MWLDEGVVVVDEGDVRVGPGLGVGIGTGMTVISLRIEGSMLVVGMVLRSVGESGPSVVETTDPSEGGAADLESPCITSPMFAQNPSRVEAVAKIPGAAVLAT